MASRGKKELRENGYTDEKFIANMVRLVQYHLNERDISDMHAAGYYVDKFGRMYSEHTVSALILTLTGSNYNHRLLWESLPKSITCGKPFDYFPRGRVEIRNSKAIVYLNPDINIKEIQAYVVETFGLLDKNGIKSVRFVSDGSNHYKYANE